MNNVRHYVETTFRTPQDHIMSGSETPLMQLPFQLLIFFFVRCSLVECLTLSALFSWYDSIGRSVDPRLDAIWIAGLYIKVCVCICFASRQYSRYMFLRPRPVTQTDTHLAY